MKVSVIIPTYNESKYIKNCVESLLLQSYKNMEIIVVDDGSTDDTIAIVSNYKNKLLLVNAKHKGAGSARNKGASRSSGEILVFVDADMTFEKNFIKKLTSPIIEKKAKGTFSKDERVSNWDNKWSRAWNINEGWAPQKRHPSKFPNFQKVFRAILKSEFNKVGGFDENAGYTDDWSLAEKLNYLAQNAEGAIFYHRNPETLDEVFLQAKWIGKRKYKLGLIGSLVALVRASIIVSVFVGLYKSLKSHTPEYILFKIIYDLGIFMGIIEYILFKSTIK